MHMSDALLSPAVGATFWAGSLAVIAFSAKKLKENLDEKMIPLMGVLGAFIFAAQMINFTIPGTGSSGHLGGGMILAVILGPHAGFIVISSVLTIQSLFFADGGILALGSNIWNLGIYPCYIAYPLIYRTIVKESSSSKRIVIASIASVVLGLQFGAISVVLQTLLSGKSELPFSTFAYMMLPIHLAIGLLEGFITAGVINYIRVAKPEILESVSSSKPFSPDISIKKIILFFLLIAVITGGLMSWFASTYPDGLEWSIEKISGSSALHEDDKGVAQSLKKLQEKTAILPDYNFKSDDHSSGPESPEQWPNVSPGTSVSGVLGAIMVICLIFVLGIGIKALRKKKN
ncbi:MAG: energy-coupling factor ABC transporter permease [Nitrospirota bacterium]